MGLVWRLKEEPPRSTLAEEPKAEICEEVSPKEYVYTTPTDQRIRPAPSVEKSPLIPIHRQVSFFLFFGLSYRLRQPEEANCEICFCSSSSKD